MNKKMKSLLLCSAVLTAGLVVNPAFAEEVQPELTFEEAKQQLTDGLAGLKEEATAALAHEVVTKEDVALVTLAEEEAAQELSKAQTSFEEAKERNMAATEKASTAEKALVQAEEDKKNASPEKLASAQEAIKTAETDLAEAKTEQAGKVEAVKEASQAVAKQETAVAVKKADLLASQEDLTKAQEAVKAAQKLIDGDNSEAKAAVAAKQAVVDSEQARLTEAEAQLLAAQKQDATRLENIEKAKKAVEAATTEVKAKEAAIADAEVVRNTITINADYLAAYKASREATGGRIEDVNNLFALAAANKASNNYVSNAKDKARKVLVNEMPDDVLRDLTFFGADLFDQIRRQTGSGRVTVTETGIEFSKTVKASVIEHNAYYHSFKSITTLYHKDHPYRKAPTAFHEFYESERQPLKAEMTVDELKQQIYDAIITNLFVPYNNESLVSALSVLGLNDSYHKKGDIFLYGYHHDPRDRVGIKNHQGLSLISREKLIDGDQVEANNEPTLVNPYTNLASESDSKQEALAAARTALREAQAQLTKFESSFEQVPTAKVSVKYAKEGLEKAQAELQEAVLALNNNADLKAKVDALNKAKTVATEKEGLVKAAQTNLDTEVATLTQLQAGLADAQARVVKGEEVLAAKEAAVVEAKAYLERLTNADKHLSAAQANLKIALEELQASQINLEATKALVELAEQYHAFIADLKANMLAAYEKQEAKTPATKTPTAKTTEASSGLSKTVSQTIALKPEFASTLKKEAVKAAALPNTGGDESSSLLYLGGGLALLGLLALKRRRETN